MVTINKYRFFLFITFQYTEDITEIARATVSKLVVEITKEYMETRIQVVSMPICINVLDNIKVLVIVK